MPTRRLVLILAVILILLALIPVKAKKGVWLSYMRSQFEASCVQGGLIKLRATLYNDRPEDVVVWVNCSDPRFELLWPKRIEIPRDGSASRDLILLASRDLEPGIYSPAILFVVDYVRIAMTPRITVSSGDPLGEFLYSSEVIAPADVDAEIARSLGLINILGSEVEKDMLLVGGPVANPVAKKYMELFPIAVNNTYPGRGKGVVEMTVLEDGRILILAAGSDRIGTKRALEYLLESRSLPIEPKIIG